MLLSLVSECTAVNHLKTAFGAVVPHEADIRRINTCSNEHIEILVHNVFQLFNNITVTLHPATISRSR